MIATDYNEIDLPELNTVYLGMDSLSFQDVSSSSLLMRSMIIDLIEWIDLPKLMYLTTSSNSNAFRYPHVVHLESESTM